MLTLDQCVLNKHYDAEHYDGCMLKAVENRYFSSIFTFSYFLPINDLNHFDPSTTEV